MNNRFRYSRIQKDLRKLRALIPFLLGILILHSQASALEASTIMIVKTMPQDGTVLTKDSEIELVIDVEYAFKETKTATISLVIQDQDANHIAETSIVVNEGSERATLRKKFKVPQNSKSIVVYTPIYLQGHETSSAAPAIAYNVKQK